MNIESYHEYARLLTNGNYQILRAGIKDGDILYYAGSLVERGKRKFFGAVIEGATAEEAYHVGVAKWQGRRLAIFEARVVGGVSPRPLSLRLPCYHVPACIEWDEAMNNRAWDLVGRRYSFLDVLRTWLRIKPKARGLHCSEYTDHILQIGGNPTPGACVRFAIARRRRNGCQNHEGGADAR
uniref:Uncharacterized protein n=1 Tax=Candidatus Kentrum sp. LPFa TaxID=2126335 RepID=A0A450WSG1_9GAMM|nr:MAG: hypothetical protein BECKLPF1236B_GA0070989_11932 [Candidatus Kentron sp. LPFa]